MNREFREYTVPVKNEPPPRKKIALSTQLQRALALLDADRKAGKRAVQAILPTGMTAIDRRLPGGGLVSGGLHEIAGPASTGFLVRLLAGLPGPVLWCVPAAEGRRLYGPGLVRAGLDPARLTIAAGPTPKDCLWAAEEGLKSRALAAVVLEPAAAVTLTASRRLHLAAEAGGGFGFVLARADGQKAALPPSAALTRWRVDAAPTLDSTETAAWSVRLQRCRGAGLARASAVAAPDGASPGQWRVATGSGGALQAVEGSTGDAPDCLSVAA